MVAMPPESAIAAGGITAAGKSYCSDAWLPAAVTVTFTLRLEVETAVLAAGVTVMVGVQRVVTGFCGRSRGGAVVCIAAVVDGESVAACAQAVGRNHDGAMPPESDAVEELYPPPERVTVPVGVRRSRYSNFHAQACCQTGGFPWPGHIDRCGHTVTVSEAVAFAVG